MMMMPVSYVVPWDRGALQERLSIFKFSQLEKLVNYKPYTAYIPMRVIGINIGKYHEDTPGCF